MLNRPALALLLLLPAAAAAQVQDLDTAISAVVRISGIRNGSRVQGSGFVVGLDRDTVTIVTASHVIEGAQFEIFFAADPTHHFSPDVFGMDAGNPNGLAVFKVSGLVPEGVTALTFELQNRPSLGAELFMVGFPEMTLEPLTSRRVLSGRRGTLLVIDQGIEEGFSGGPVLQNGKVVGIVTATGDQRAYAITAFVAHEALEGWGAKFGVLNKNATSFSTGLVHSPPPVDLPEKAATEKCVRGEERTEDGIDYVRICPGTFTMGSAANDSRAWKIEKPAHQVTLSEEFWLGRTEITNAQYRRFQPAHHGEDKLPAVDVSWTQAKMACEYFGGRLPTEGEWEYAARAGSTAAWSFGDAENRLGDYAWFDKNAASISHPVATKKPNAWGLYDMHGNVLEWVADWMAPYTAAAQRNPTGPAGGEFHELRGGSFGDSPTLLRSANRGRYQPYIQYWYIGFRCARGPRQ